MASTISKNIAISAANPACVMAMNRTAARTVSALSCLINTSQ
jgi:hypothetical protein